jgi:hypothetical protein
MDGNIFKNQLIDYPLVGVHEESVKSVFWWLAVIQNVTKNGTHFYTSHFRPNLLKKLFSTTYISVIFYLVMFHINRKQSLFWGQATIL